MGKKATPTLKQSLLRIAEQIDKNTTLEDVYEQLAMLTDIERSEEDVNGGVFIHKNRSKRKQKNG